jgi:hypothetical protein
MTSRVYSVRMPENVIVQINAFARDAGVTRAAATRMLVQRALGLGLPRLLVDEKVLETRNLLHARIRDVLGQLRAELHGALDEVTSTSASEPEADEEDEEPIVPAMRGRARKPAKARRR